MEVNRNNYKAVEMKDKVEKVGRSEIEMPADTGSKGYMESVYGSESYIQGEKIETFGYYSIAIGAVIVLAGVIMVLVGRRMKKNALEKSK